MANRVGWFDNKGIFHPVSYAVAGSFERVETGFGMCSVKMRREDDPPANILALREAEAKKKADADPHTLKFYKSERDADAAAFCSCGWETRISSFGFVTDKSAKREAERRHTEHLKSEGRA